MRNRPGRLSACAATLLIPMMALAQSTPVGLWRTIDDNTHAETSQVRIAEQGGVLTGTIEKLVDPKVPNPSCDKCDGDRKGRPLIGLDIIRGARHDAEDKALWTGGEILDPGSGTTYRLRLKPIADGKQLEVRGFIGSPMFGRTQTWIRVE